MEEQRRSGRGLVGAARLARITVSQFTVHGVMWRLPIRFMLGTPPDGSPPGIPQEIQKGIPPGVVWRAPRYQGSWRNSGGLGGGYPTIPVRRGRGRRGWREVEGVEGGEMRACMSFEVGVEEEWMEEQRGPGGEVAGW